MESANESTMEKPVKKETRGRKSLNLSDEEKAKRHRDRNLAKVECNLCQKSLSMSNYAKHVKTTRHLEKEKVFLNIFVHPPEPTAASCRKSLPVADSWTFYMGKHKPASANTC